MTTSRFIIVEHKAKRAGLHYDLRFRIPSSKDWASFAVPKGVPTEPGKKVTAIKTTIHTEKDALLTGKIEQGYGAGTLKKWDSGSCNIIKYSDRHMVIDFGGSKVKGIYHLISTGVIDKDYNKPTYLLFKGKMVSEGCGMISRIPSRGISSDVEEGQAEDEEENKTVFG